METNKTINEKWQVRFDGMSIYTTTAKGLSLIATTETKHLFHVGLNQAKHNAERIVECVNNYDALKEENERLKNIAYDLTGKVADLKDIREQENFKHKEENERLKEALHNLYNFTLGKEGYLDSCLNDAEYALHKSTVKEDGNNEQ